MRHAIEKKFADRILFLFVAGEPRQCAQSLAQASASKSFLACLQQIEEWCDEAGIILGTHGTDSCIGEMVLVGIGVQIIDQLAMYLRLAVCA